MLRRASVVALVGELASGKTTFAQGLARGLGIKEKILSPTFVLMQPFKLDISTPPSLSLRRPRQNSKESVSQYRNIEMSRFWHVDCYRLEKPEELAGLGFREILKDPKNIVVTEWADKVKNLLPRSALWITFEHGEEENERIITLKTKDQKPKIKNTYPKM